MKQLSASFLVSLSFGFFSSLAWAQSTSPIPAVDFQVDHAILAYPRPDGKPVQARIHLNALNFPGGDALTYSWRQVQDVLSPNAAQMGEGKVLKFSFVQPAELTAIFPESGVYEIQLTITDPARHLTARRNTWINVWDARSPILVNGKPDPLCAAPGVNPPKSVRNLPPDPGPFQHPRIFCTAAEWQEIKARSQQGKLGSMAWKKLQEELTDSEHGLDGEKSDDHKLTVELKTYADSLYQGNGPDLVRGIAPETKDGKPDWSAARRNLSDYQFRLKDACLVAWLNVDPTQPESQVDPKALTRCRDLAKVVAAFSHLYLTNCWDSQTGAFKKDYPLYIPHLDEVGENPQEFQYLALAYDFIVPWMTPDELRETRNFLFAVGVGRATGARWFVPQVDGVWLNRSVERGSQQNGDFMNIEELKIATALSIAGEESDVDPRVVKAFTTAPQPGDYATSGKAFACDWIQPTSVDSGRNYAGSKPYPEAGNWPFARKVEVDNLQRAIFWNDDWYVSPWGFLMNKEAYYGFSAYGLWPAAMAYARHGAFNMYVGCNFYQTALHHLYCYYPGEVEQKTRDFSTHIYFYDHHDGGFDSRQVHALFLKYMYPDDPLVDYVYTPYAVSMEQRLNEPFLTVLFGLDPGLDGHPTALPDLAAEQALPLTKVDPQIGVVVARSGWKEDDMMFYFDDGWAQTGHMHAEKNSFAFFALGRSWASSPGYHQKLNNFYSTIMIQDPAWAKDPTTEGYMGESESMEPEGSPYPKCHPTPPGHLIEVRESPDQLYSFMAGDARAAYDFCYCGRDNPAYPEITPPFTRADFMYPGLLEVLLKRLPDPLNKEFLTGKRNNVGWEDHINSGYNPVQYAFRSVLFVRGPHPYVLIVDDFKKEDAPRNYRWMMNSVFSFGSADGKFADASGQAANYSMLMAPGSTATQATLLHLPDQENKPGLPRLMVRDVSEVDNQNQPPMRMDTTIFEKFGKVLTDRIFIDRHDVVEPKYKILLYPYRQGEDLPETSWNTAHTQLTIKLPNGTTDRITCEANPDHRTRLSFKRTGP